MPKAKGKHKRTSIFQDRAGTVKSTPEVEALGMVPSTHQPGHASWSVLLLQIAHVGQSPTCDEPAFRICRFCPTEREALGAAKVVTGKVRGSVLAMKKNSTTLICKTLARQADALYVRKRTVELKKLVLAEARERDMEHIINRRCKQNGDLDSVKQQQRSFFREYNARGHIQYMRKVLKIDKRIVIIPGSHTEAEDRTRVMKTRRKAAARAGPTTAAAAAAAADELASKNDPAYALDADGDKDSKPFSLMFEEDELQAIRGPDGLELDSSDASSADSSDTEDDEDGHGSQWSSPSGSDAEGEGSDGSDTEDGGSGAEDDGRGGLLGSEEAYPPLLRHRDQKFAVISFAIEHGKDMELLLWVFGTFATQDTAKRWIHEELSDVMDPLTLHVVDMYEWIYPVRMLWEDSAASQRVEGLQETWAGQGGDRLSKTQTERKETLDKTRHIKNAVRSKKKLGIDPGVRQSICERLEITDDVLEQILQHPDLGDDEVVRLSEIHRDRLRARSVQLTLKVLRDNPALPLTAAKA